MPTPLATIYIDAAPGSGSTTIDVPAGTTGVVAFSCHWTRNIGSVLGTLSLGGQSLLPALQQRGDNGDENGAGIFFLPNPPTGQQLVQWSWTPGGARVEGGEIVFIFLTDLNSDTPVRGWDLVSGTLSQQLSLTIPTAPDDLILAFAERYFDPPAGTPALAVDGGDPLLQEANFNTHTFVVAQVTPSAGSTTTISMTGEFFSTLAVISLPAAAVRTTVGRDAPTAWNVRTTVGRDAPTAWNVLTTAGSDAPAAWNVLATAGRDAPLAWNIADVDVVTVGRDAGLGWNIQGLAGRDAPTAWNVRTKVGRDAGLAWSIRTRIGRDASMAWNVKGEAIADGHYRVHLRVLVKDAAGDWKDLSQFEGEDWIVSARLEDDIDFPVAQAEVTLWREGPQGSIAPFMASPLNIPGPLIDAGRELKIETQITAVDATPDPADWRTVFHGHIDHVSWPRRESRVTVRARDLGGTLLDTWIETEATYGSEAGTPIETVMQQLLDATLGQEKVVLVVPESPGFLITPYTQEPMSLLEALQRLADLIGWTVRYRWHEASGAFRLTLYEPPRDNTTPVAVIGPDQYIDIEDLAIDRAGIRNVVSVSYRDAETGQRAEVVVSDATSIARYGRRWMQIQEADTSPIDTQAEAQRLAEAALSDLALPHAEQEIEMHYWWPVKIGDLLRFEPNGVHYSDPQDLAVVSWRHELAVGRARTWIRTRGKPAGAYRRWFFATRDRIGAPAVTPTLDEDRSALYLHPHRNEFAGSIRYVVSTTAEPTLEQVRAGTVSAAERILVHTFSDTGQEQRVYVGVLPYRRANGTGAEGGLVVLAYTYRPGNDVPVVTWFPITPSAPDKEAVRLVVNDDGDQVALFYRAYAKGSSPPAFTRVPASGWASDPLVHDVEVSTPAEGAPNILLEAYGEDDEGRRTARTVVIEFDHGEAPSGEFQLEVDEGGKVWCQINTLDPDTGSARVRVVKGPADTPAFESLTFTDDVDPSDGKVELARTVSAFADRIDTGLTLGAGEAVYLVGRFFRTLSTSPAAQQASRASAETRTWRAMMTAGRPPRANIRVVGSSVRNETLEFQGFLGTSDVGLLEYRWRVIDQATEGAWGPGPGDGWASLPTSPFPQQMIQRATFWPRMVELQVRDANLQVAEARHTISPELPGLDDQTGKVRPDVELADGSGIFRKPSPGAPDTADAIPDGTVKRITTINEATGGGRAFVGLLADGTVAPGKVVGTSIQDGAVIRQKIAAGAIRDEHYSSSPSDKLATVKYRLPPTVEVEVLSSTDYQITFRITARDADGGQVRIRWRVVDTPSESYTTPTPTSSGALQPQPFTMNVTVDRDAGADPLFEVWSEDEDGNLSAIARRTIPRIVAPANALTNVNAALFSLGSTCPSQLVDRVTWTRDPAVPALWRVEVWIIEGTTTGDPFSGTRISSNAASPFNTTRLTNVRTGTPFTYARRYGVRLVNSRGSVIDEERPLGLSGTYDRCPE